MKTSKVTFTFDDVSELYHIICNRGFCSTRAKLLSALQDLDPKLANRVMEADDKAFDATPHNATTGATTTDSGRRMSGRDEQPIATVYEPSHAAYIVKAANEYPKLLEMMDAAKEALAFIDDGEGGYSEAEVLRAAIAKCEAQP